MRKNLIRFTAVLLAFQGVIAAQLLTLKPAQAADAPKIAINEVMWMGTRDSGGIHSADEWVELYNTTQEDVDIQGWKLTNVAAGGGDLSLPTGTPLVVPAEGYFLVSNYSETSSGSVLDVAPDLVDSALALSDTCPVDGVTLETVTSEVVDQISCFGSSWPAGVSNAIERRAMERVFPVGAQKLWQTSLGYVNLDADAEGHTYATPLTVNDRTEPQSGIVRDGQRADIDWTDETTEIHVNWTEFTDLESGIVEYLVGIGSTPVAADVVTLTPVGMMTHAHLSYPAEMSAGTFYSIVVARNGVGIEAVEASDGYTIDIVDPEAPTGVMVTDTPSDNGGSVHVDWTASASVDEITYQLNYRKRGELSWVSVLAGSGLTYHLTGLENAPITYEVTVQAIDFSGRMSALSAIANGQAIDNLAPVLDKNRLVVAQNIPGNSDTVSGLPAALNEPATVSLFDRDPSVPGAVLLGSLVTNIDGSFAAISIGDNQYGTVFAQATDTAGNPSLTHELKNDIVAPNAASLEKAIATCQSETCRIELSWKDNGPDTVLYRVNYVVNGVTTVTGAISGTAITLDLPVGAGAVFTVSAFDAYGNRSAESNAITVQLTAGVKTIATFSNGSQLTTTEALPGSREVVEAPSGSVAPATIAPTAKAASPEDQPSDQPDVKQANDQDWTRIFIVIVLLLAVAAGFYSLSRSFRDAPSDEPIVPKAEPEKKPQSTQSAQKNNQAKSGSKKRRRR